MMSAPVRRMLYSLKGTNPKEETRGPSPAVLLDWTPFSSGQREKRT